MTPRNKGQLVIVVFVAVALFALYVCVGHPLEGQVGEVGPAETPSSYSSAWGRDVTAICNAPPSMTVNDPDLCLMREGRTRSVISPNLLSAPDPVTACVVCGSKTRPINLGASGAFACTHCGNLMVKP